MSKMLSLGRIVPAKEPPQTISPTSTITRRFTCENCFGIVAEICSFPTGCSAKGNRARLHSRHKAGKARSGHVTSPHGMGTYMDVYPSVPKRDLLSHGFQCNYFMSPAGRGFGVRPLQANISRQQTTHQLLSSALSWLVSMLAVALKDTCDIRNL